MKKILPLILLLSILFVYGEPTKEGFYQAAKKYVNSSFQTQPIIQTDKEMREMFKSMKAQFGDTEQVKELEAELEKDKYLVTGVNGTNPMESIQVFYTKELEDEDQEMEKGFQKGEIDGREFAAGVINDMGLSMGIIIVKLNSGGVLGIVKTTKPNSVDDMKKEVQTFGIKSFDK
jgi:hypothetical protein